MSSPPISPLAAGVYRLWFVASILAACETWLIFDALPGINWLLSTLASVVAFIAFLRAARKPTPWQRMTPLALACVLAGGAAVTSSGFMDALIAIGVLASLAFGMLAATDPPATEQSRPRSMLTAPLAATGAVLRESARRSAEMAREGLRTGQSVAVLRGLGLALPVIVVFGWLLSYAEPVFGQWRDDIARLLSELSWLPRAIFLVVIAIMLLGAFGLALRALASDAARPQQIRRAGLGTTERVIILGAVVVLFGLFLGLQVPHFFGDLASVPGSGVTYAQTVHEGFRELTIVSALCILLVVGVTRGSPDDASQSSGKGAIEGASRLLIFAVILETLLLVVSALNRMRLYEVAYGFTASRLYVQIFDGLILLALLLMAWQFRGAPDFTRLSRQIAAACVLSVAGLSYWNHMGWIVRSNVARYERTGSIDVIYLATQPDGAPELLRALPRLSASLQISARHCLANRYGADTSAFAKHAWYEWSARRAVLQASLQTAGLLRPEAQDHQACWSPVW